MKKPSDVVKIDPAELRAAIDKRHDGIQTMKDGMLRFLAMLIYREDGSRPEWDEVTTEVLREMLQAYERENAEEDEREAQHERDLDRDKGTRAD